MTEVTGFLSDLAHLHWKPLAKHSFRESGLFLGQGANAIEVAVARTSAEPPRVAMLETWKARRGGRPAPVVLVALHPKGAAMCGASGVDPPVHLKMEPRRIERLCREVLGQPDRHAALRFLSQALPSLDTAIPGITNEGLLALHELQHGVPERDDWTAAKRKAANALGKRGKDILTALGFRIEQIDNLTYRLRAGGRSAALAVLLREDEAPEAGNDRFNSLSPVSYALKKADDENLPWAVLTQGSRLRLYAASVDAGVGQRGRTETFVECQPSLLSEEQMPYLWLLFSAEALAPNGSLFRILKDSQRFSGDLAERLRERIYDKVVPILATGIAAQQNSVPTHEGLARTYEMALTVLFRLLFIAYAEDRDLLPYRTNDAYRRRSLKQKAQELADHVASKTPVADGDTHWQEVRALWRAVAVGNSEWGVPAYNGGLFAEDPKVSEVGSALARISLPNEIFEAALRHLLVIDTAEGVPGPVDFRSLGVREFGTVYEGLLESELAHADTDLVLSKKGAYMSAREGQTVVVAAGEVYLHNRSGARKSSGSYYTKPFAVEHLLDGALEPAIDDHFARLDGKDDAAAAAAFFDFRVADIAMGSGHFLISAIDRIEKRMAGYLSGRSLPGVRRELADLRAAAAKSLGVEAAEKIEDGQLLRRQIARRCIYGVDLNPLSVQLARLSVWIHTFVLGLPLSFLDRNLVRGNALFGVGTIDELRNAVRERSLPLFAVDAESLLGAAKIPLRRLATLNDATLRDIAAARTAEQEAQDALNKTKTLFDFVAALRISDNPESLLSWLDEWDSLDCSSNMHPDFSDVYQDLRRLDALHFPVAFPEVFLRNRPGFDVMIGNPPWRVAMSEERDFWVRHFPGLRGLSQGEQAERKARLRADRPDLVAIWKAEHGEAERIRKALVCSDFPGMGTGDPDLYKAFCWRFWRLSADGGGRIGVVLPRSALAAKGSTEFRRTVFKNAARVDVTMLLNSLQWVFPEVHQQYSIGLVCIARGTTTEKFIRLLGPFASESSFRRGVTTPPPAFKLEDMLAWNDTVSLPLLPDPDSVAVFAQIREAPRLDMNKSRTGGGGTLVPTGSWTRLYRRGLCRSTSRSRVALPTGHRTPHHGAEALDVLRRPRASGQLLASVQGGILRHLEP